MKSKDKLLLHSNMTIGHKNSFKGPLRKGTTSVSLKRTLSQARRAASQDQTQFNRGAIRSIFTIVGYSSIWDQLLLLFGCLLALANGIGWPLINFLVASFSDELSVLLITQRTRRALPIQSCSLNDTWRNSSISSNYSAYLQNITLQYCDGNGSFKEEYNLPTSDEWMQQIWAFTLPAVGTGFLVLITGYLYVYILHTVSERIVLRARKLYLKSILRQNMAWLDSRSQGELTASIMRSMGLIQTSLGEKLGLLLFCLSEITISLIFCFWSGWKLTLVLSCLYPILIVIARISTQVQHKMNKVIRVLNGELAGLIQEVLSAIRTVMAFGGEEKEFRRYLQRLGMSREMNIKQTIIGGMNYSFIFLITQCFISLGFWYGLKLMQYTEEGLENYTPRDVIMINILVLLSGIFIRLAVPLLNLVVNGFSAAVDIVNVIERTPEIDSYCEQGITLQQLQGNIEFSNVHFWYPTSVGEKKILKGLNLKIRTGETVALVGPSGGGKSTILHLIQRFYDPQKGKIKIDDKNLQEFNLGWFRRKIGIVSQEPSLFNTTIRENIRFGNEDATNEEIIRAAKEANAHDFIMKLPQQYDTTVGEQGGQMSGGERQRIAIARALVRDPSILLLDEATSALDNESEVIVQESLDKARSGRTTVVIAHRLSTIRKSDRIVAVKGGRVVEQGTHEELNNKPGGVYRQLLSQLSGDTDKTESTDEDEASYTDEESEEEQGTDEEEDDGSDIEYPEYDISTIEDEKEERSEIKKSFWKILQYSKDDWGYILGGIIFAVICGCYHTGRCIVFASITNMVVLKDFHNDKKTILFPCLYVVIGFIAFVAFSLKAWSYSRSQENLLFRVRQRAFDSILHQEIGWFDNPKKGVTSLVSLLTVEAENVKYIPGTMLGTWVYTVIGSVLLITVSIYYNWKLALATATLAIFNFINQYVHARIVRGALFGIQGTEEKANNLAVEAIRSIRTVISLHIEDIICRRYDAALGNPRSFLDRQIHLRSIISGFSDALTHFGFTVALSYGGYLMYLGEASYFDYNVVISMMIINLMEIAQVLASCPQRSKSCVAAYKLLQAIKRKPLIDSNPAAGLRLPTNIETKIAFRDVRFAYPTRPQEEILQGLNIVIEEGQTVAFVGKSGCGKSTAFQLLQRMYDPTSGSVAISGYDLRCVNMPSLRALIGIVSQEPTLFNRTIRENIQYGDNSRDVCMHEIIDAAKQANIHEFIISLRQGYDTRIGPRGVQLSGGQKQRVAIARALIKNPRILLLDEATSALDNESERIVQEALEKAREGRTCLVIAHRLSTVQNADQIAVFSGGQIVEKGTPQELIEARGLYFDFVQIHAGKMRRVSRPIL